MWIIFSINGDKINFCHLDICNGILNRGDESCYHYNVSITATRVFFIIQSTFQAVIASDGEYTYSIFNYYELNFETDEVLLNAYTLVREVMLSL